jgi:hypothetical protein
MMSESKATTQMASAGQQRASSAQLDMSDEERSKDAFFVHLAELTEAMIAAHGKDFAIGALVLSAKFVAEGKPLIKRTSGGGETVSIEKPS